MTPLLVFALLMAGGLLGFVVASMFAFQSWHRGYSEGILAERQRTGYYAPHRGENARGVTREEWHGTVESTDHPVPTHRGGA